MDLGKLSLCQSPRSSVNLQDQRDAFHRIIDTDISVKDTLALLVDSRHPNFCTELYKTCCPALSGLSAFSAFQPLDSAFDSSVIIRTIPIPNFTHKTCHSPTELKSTATLIWPRGRDKRTLIVHRHSKRSTHWRDTTPESHQDSTAFTVQTQSKENLSL